MWFVKARRAQNEHDDETWITGGVCTTLNAFDNGGESRATVLIVESFDEYNFKLGGELHHSLRAGTQQSTGVLVIDGTRVGDVRVTEASVMQTVIQRWGTGGNNVPVIFPIQDGREMEKNQNGLGVGSDSDPSYTLDRTGAQSVAVAPTITAYNMDSRSPQSAEQQNVVGAVHSVTSVVRRLTPMECERLQGFPDGWTDSQSDTQRYKQMGNAVTVNVIKWIGSRL